MISEKERSRRYRERHPQRFRKLVNKSTQKLKHLVISYYSKGTMKCVMCGCLDMRCLSIDHIEGGGNKHRRKVKRSSGHEFWNWLKKNNFPKGYQVLCMNCQWIKRHIENECAIQN